MPSTFATGYRYALLGYTTVVEAAAPPLAARHVLAELRDTPMIDAAFLVLMGNNLALFDLIRRDPARVRDAIAWWLEATGGYGVKLVNPGGVERWKRGNGNVTSLDDAVAGRHAAAGASRRSPRRCTTSGCRIRSTSTATTSACAGNARTTLDTLRTLEGRRAHLAHLQFHAYGGQPGGRPRSRAPELAEYLGAHPELSADVGQVMFGARDDDDRRRARVRAAARRHAAAGSTPTPRSRPAAGSCRSRTARRTTSTRCSGASGSSCSCSAATRGGSCSRPTTPTAARSSATRG